MKPSMLTALAAIMAIPVATEEEAVTELTRLQPEMTRQREYAAVVGEELAERDPAKAVTKIRALRAENEQFKLAAKTALTAAAKASAEATIKEYEPRINSKPLREMLLRQLTGELEAGKKLDETETLATLKSLPKATQLTQSSSADAGGDQLDDEDKIDATARELMTTNPRLKALVAKGEDHEAYKAALLLAEKQLKGAAKTA